MDCPDVIAWLHEHASQEVWQGLERYGIPTDNAIGVPMGELKVKAKQIGRSHECAAELWATGIFEARSLAAFIDEPERVTAEQMDAWANDFDSWAIVDTVCFALFDRTPYAWDKVSDWAPRPEEFVRRAAYALWWALVAHDKASDDRPFLESLQMLEDAEPDGRLYVKKAMDMALRATGKRKPALRAPAINTARRMSEDADKNRSWVGRHALRELERSP